MPAARGLPWLLLALALAQAAPGPAIPALLEGHTLTVEDTSMVLERVEGLVAPHFAVVVRGPAGAKMNRTVALPSCLYRAGREGIQVSVSLCGEEPQGTLVRGGTSHLLDFSGREKRQVEDIMKEDKTEVKKVETVADGECGINQRNKAKMKVGDRPVVRLRRAARRSKRAARERTIEVAIFVDDVMYSKVDKSKAPGADTVDTIKNIVFTYMNAVQQIYSSPQLDSRLRLVLVRLDILSSPAADLDKEGGDIEGYLENFCRSGY